jgi:aspartyl/asparaginyl-tRNA synthetase
LFALAGLCLLFFYAREIEPVQLSSVTLADEGRLASFSGYLESVRETDGNYFLSVCSGGECVKCVVFAKLAASMNERTIDLGGLESGAWVSFEGIVREYQGEPELVAITESAIEVK